MSEKDLAVEDVDSTDTSSEERASEGSEETPTAERSEQSPVAPASGPGAGLGRGAVAGLLATIAVAAVDAALALGAGGELGGAGAATLALYGTGLMGLLLVPYGAFAGASLSAAGMGRLSAIGATLTGLARDPERDAIWSARLVGGVAGLAILAILAGTLHAVMLHDLNNKLLASVFTAILMTGAGVVGLLSAALTTALALPLVRRLPLAGIGRPWRVRLAGVVYLLGGTAGLVAAVGFARFYDPAVWAPAFIAQVALAGALPLFFFFGLGAAGTLGRRVDRWWLAPIVMAALLGVAYVPITSFEPNDPVRIASFEDTQLERRVLGIYLALGDRDGDGFAGLLGGPDCDDANPDINPAARDIPANGIDENCIGGDAKPPVERKRSKVPRQVLLAAQNGLTMSALGGSGAQAIPPPKPVADLRGKNFLIIQVDTIRQDHLGYAGYERATSPELDKIAAQSVVFERAYAQAPNTPRSMPSIFTSRYPSEVHWYKRYRNFSPIRDEALTLFEVLADNGYVNHSLTSHWYFREERKLQTAFAEWDNEGSVDIAPSNTDISSPRIYERFNGHLDRLEATGNPWSFFIHLPDPHGRYMKHKGEGSDFGNKLMDKYDSEIHYVDQYVGKMWSDLETRGLLENTVVIIISDHGEAFGEHGHHFHGQTIYEEILRVPFIVYVPGMPPTRVATRVELIDIAPTLLDGAGIPIPEAFSGRSLIGAIEDPTSLASKPIYAEHLACPSWDEEMRILIVDDVKIYWRVTKGFYELYDLNADPGEKTNIYRKDKELAAKMRTAITEYVEQTLRRP